jgi:hypothetical protein
MAACGNGDDFLPIAKMLLNHFKIEVNQQNKVIVIIRMSIFIFILYLFSLL